jgi:hypothetical protein
MCRKPTVQLLSLTRSKLQLRRICGDAIPQIRKEFQSLRDRKSSKLVNRDIHVSLQHQRAGPAIPAPNGPAFSRRCPPPYCTALAMRRVAGNGRLQRVVGRRLSGFPRREKRLFDVMGQMNGHEPARWIQVVFFFLIDYPKVAVTSSPLVLEDLVNFPQLERTFVPGIADADRVVSRVVHGYEV